MLISNKIKRIKQLKAEIKALKTRLKDGERSGTSSFSRSDQAFNSDTPSNISPDEITINFQEYDSVSSISTDSNMSTDSFIIFTNEPFVDEIEDSDSFSGYMDNEDNIENTRDASEYRNAESQTIDSFPLQDELHRNGNLVHENDSTTVEVPNSVFGEPSQSGRPVKRRPTIQKPAKRRHRPATLSSDDDNEENGRAHIPSQSLKYDRNAENDNKDVCIETNQDNNSISHEAGPSSAPARNSRPTVTDQSRSRNIKYQQKRAKHAANSDRNNSVSSSVPVNSDNRVFERTLALLEEYNLESDPDWLPEYASHRGNDTTTESDSSYSFNSSNSELSDDSLENSSLDDSDHERPAMSNFMNWYVCKRGISGSKS